MLVVNNKGPHMTKTDMIEASRQGPPSTFVFIANYYCHAKVVTW